MHQEQVDRARHGEHAARGRLVLADDDVLLRAGMVSLLEQAGFQVLGQADHADELLRLVQQHTPDLAIVDVRMPPNYRTEGLVAAQVIREHFWRTGVLVLSAYVEVEHALDLLASGQRVGYLLKSRVTSVTDFLDALDRIIEGGSVVDPALVHELLSAVRPDDPLADLSGREREVLALMAEGRSNAGIARQLWVTESTVEKHVQHIMTKLELPDTGDDHRRVLAVVRFLEIG
jgi:DNA-binding NarL/FixJ family response regulator